MSRTSLGGVCGVELGLGFGIGGDSMPSGWGVGQGDGERVVMERDWERLGRD